MVDQRLLPGEFREVSYTSYDQVAQAIQQMVVRGAPAIGAAAAFGMALAAYASTARGIDAFQEDMAKAAQVLEAARPTAVNLAWAIARMSRKAGEVAELAPEDLGVFHQVRLGIAVTVNRDIDPVDVAEVVVDDGCQSAGRKGASCVVDLVPELRPDDLQLVFRLHFLHQ